MMDTNSFISAVYLIREIQDSLPHSSGATCLLYRKVLTQARDIADTLWREKDENHACANRLRELETIVRRSHSECC